MPKVASKIKNQVFMLFMKYILLLILLLYPLFLQSQDDQLSKDIATIVYLDSFVVSATQQGFQVADFIDIVQADESFFSAFHNLRFQEYYSDNDIQLFNRKGEEQAIYESRIHQEVVGNCRTMKLLTEEVGGNFFKNKKKRQHRYYTARMHESIFYTTGKVCDDRNGPGISEESLSGIAKHVNELKKLIFQPGREVQVPLIGGKTAIFKKEMLQYYQFSIKQDAYENGVDAYIFTAVAKPDYKPNKTIIKYLETWFDKKTFQVLGRNYHLYYSGIVDFDVKMKVELQQLEGLYIPKYIQYNGNWKVPLQKREHAKFSIAVDPVR